MQVRAFERYIPLKNLNSEILIKVSVLCRFVHVHISAQTQFYEITQN